jgi:hypothetical protein
VGMTTLYSTNMSPWGMSWYDGICCQFLFRLRTTHALALNDLDLARLRRAAPPERDGAVVEGREVAFEAEECLCVSKGVTPVGAGEFVGCSCTFGLKPTPPARCSIMLAPAHSPQPHST